MTRRAALVAAITALAAVVLRAYHRELTSIRAETDTT